jgi:hypothetical protein
MITATAVACLICQQPLLMRLAKGRKSGKVFVMLLCSVDARHFRGFINDRAYVDSVLARLEGHTVSLVSGSDANDNPTDNGPSNIVSEGQSDR